MGSPDLDGKADVYSLGVMFYEMLAATLPFEAKHGFDFMAAHVRLEPRPLDTLAPEVPHEVVNLVHSMLDKSPRVRPSMETVVAILDQLRAATPGLWTTGRHQALPSQSAGEIEFGATMPGQTGPGNQRPSSMPGKQEVEHGATVPGHSLPPSQRSKNDLVLPTPLAPLKLELPSASSQPASAQSASAQSLSAQSLSAQSLPSATLSGAVGPQAARRSALLLVLVGIFTFAVLGTGLVRMLPARSTPAAAPPPPRMVKWILQSTPPGAEVVRADGQLLGTTPWEAERPMAPGETVVTLRLPGWQPKSLTLSHSSGLRTELHLERLEPPAAQPAPAQPQLSAAAAPTSARIPSKPAKHKKGRQPASAAKPGPGDDVQLLD